jgi:hypothetical protein
MVPALSSHASFDDSPNLAKISAFFCHDATPVFNGDRLETFGFLIMVR